MINNILSSVGGKFFTVVFTKKDGTVRRLNGRTGVRRHLKGGDVPAGHVSTRKDMLVVYDVKSKGYRCLSRDSIRAIRCGGVEAVVL